MASLADRLSAARRRQFVGRNAELDLVRQALSAPELPFHVVQLYGPGGVGKTSLLKEFARICTEQGGVAVYVDARNIEPAPVAFLNALRTAMEIDQSESPVERIAASTRRHLILIDTYETLEPLDAWLREEFLPGLSENVLIVTAGRNTPAPEWRIDAGWQALVRAVPLRNLTPDESREYLERRDVPIKEHAGVLGFTHGHPLALSLIADTFAQRSDTRFQPEAVPDVVKTLLEQFVQKVPGPAHRAALECCSLVRVTTETLLGEMLAMPDTHELFEWLRGLSFIESGAEGLFPHDLAREALAADLRWRNPDWHVELHDRARAYYAGHLLHASSHEQQRLLLDYIYLHRDNPVIRSIFQWQGAAGATAEPAAESDWSELEGMVREHEGEDSARLAAYWLRRQPSGVLALRDGEGTAVGMLSMVALQQVSATDRTTDPAIDAALRYLERSAPLRTGEKATHFRFWMARDSYQAVSPVQSVVFVNVARHYLTTPSLAFTFFPCADADSWAPGFAYVDLHRIVEADYEIGGHRYGVYGHDWRVVPPLKWLEILAEREIAGAPDPAAAQPHEQLVVLSEPEFAAAVLDALRCFVDPGGFGDNPLLGSRLVVERTSADTPLARSETLHTLLKDSAESLQSSPRGTKFYRALYRTYINPASSQERAAELLDLPFSTYRRHLKSGIEEMTEMLWGMEIGKSEGGRVKGESQKGEGQKM